MAWTTPLNWTTDQVVTEADLDTYVSANTLYLKDLFDGVQTQTWTPRLAGAHGDGVEVTYGKARGASLAAPALVNASDILGYLGWAGHDGTAYRKAVQFRAFVDGTPGSFDMPGGLSLLTAADGGITLTEHWRFRQNGEAWFQDFTEGSGLLTLAGIGANVQSTGLRIWYDSGPTTRNVQIVTQGETAVAVGRNNAGSSKFFEVFYQAVFNDAVQVNNSSTTAFSIGTGSGDLLADSNANWALNTGNLWLGTLNHNASHGSSKIIISDQGAPGVSPPTNHAILWWDNASSTFKYRNSAGTVKTITAT